MTEPWKNKLYFGDNLDILRKYVPSESIDLIYLDPPFNSKATYNVLFKTKNGAQVAAQIAAFEDTWHWSIESEIAYREVIVGGGKISALLEALFKFLGPNDIMAYLTMMAIRLKELHRVLKPTGAIYLHCDPTASHYLKLLMDAIFGVTCFKNEIIWKRTTTKSDYRQGATNWPRVHDVLLYYQRRPNTRNTFTQPFAEYSEEYLEKFYRHRDPDGRRYMLDNLAAPGAGSRGHPQYEFMGVTRYWRYNKDKMERLLAEGRIVQTKPGAVPRYKRYLDEMPGVAIGDVWTDISPLQAHARERLGYQTQKPEALLRRIIKANSNEGDVVLDPFCGCGTAINVAEELGRKWIGIDIAYVAILLVKRRLKKSFEPELAPFVVEGTPKTLQDARTMAESGPHGRYQFQWWVLDQLGARGVNERKKGADRGVDGMILFFDDDTEIPKKILIQVKSGHVGRGDIAKLRGDMEAQGATLGAFVTLQPWTAPMEKEALAAGFYTPPAFPAKRVRRIQLLTAEDLFAGKTIDYYKLGTDTFKEAPSKPDKKSFIDVYDKSIVPDSPD